jgi:hypothetical protein
MAHFAELDENNFVIRVVVVDNERLMDENGVEQESLGIAHLNKLEPGGRWVQTSYNSSFRKNYAGIGAYYDEEKDAFYGKQSNNPHAIWNEEKCRWIDPYRKDNLLIGVTRL